MCNMSIVVVALWALYYIVSFGFRVYLFIACFSCLDNPFSHRNKLFNSVVGYRVLVWNCENCLSHKHSGWCRRFKFLTKLDDNTSATAKIRKCPPRESLHIKLYTFAHIVAVLLSFCLNEWDESSKNASKKLAKRPNQQKDRTTI